MEIQSSDYNDFSFAKIRDPCYYSVMCTTVRTKPHPPSISSWCILELILSSLSLEERRLCIIKSKSTLKKEIVYSVQCFEQAKGKATKAKESTESFFLLPKVNIGFAYYCKAYFNLLRYSSSDRGNRIYHQLMAINESSWIFHLRSSLPHLPSVKRSLFRS